MFSIADACVVNVFFYMEDVVDLTGNDVSLEEDQLAKQRIMEFARAKLHVDGKKTLGPEAPAPAGLSEDTAQHAAKRSKDNRDTSSSHAEAGPSGRLPEGPLYPMSDTLHMLALERQARNAARARQASAEQPRAQPPSSGTTSQPQQQQQAAGQQQQPEASGDRSCSIMTYNIWFAEDVQLEARMAGLNSLIVQHKPDFILLQEVTVNMVKIFYHAPWTDLYNIEPPPNPVPPYFTLLATRKATVEVVSSKRVPFNSTQMGRDVLYVQARVKPEGRSRAFALPLCVGTSHLESPCGPDCVPVRIGQLAEALGLMSEATAGDVVYGGDMNWVMKDHATDPVLPHGWQDMWTTLRPGESGRKFNPMTGFMGGRIDRLFGRLGGMWEPGSIQMVGTEPLPGVRTTTRGKDAPVLISDHFGVLLHLRQRRGRTLAGNNGGASTGGAAAAPPGPSQPRSSAPAAGGAGSRQQGGARPRGQSGGAGGNKRGREQQEGQDDQAYQGFDAHEQQLLGRGRTAGAKDPDAIYVSNSDDDLL